MSSSRTTTDHDEIRKWVEERNGRPATVTETKDDSGAGVLRIDFDDGEQEDTLEQIDWDTFFQKFDEQELVFLYQDETSDGGVSRFCKFVSRESANQEQGS